MRLKRITRLCCLLDSEHNAIFQCLPFAIQQDSSQIHQPNHGVRKLWLTASGGPFFAAIVCGKCSKQALLKPLIIPIGRWVKRISVDSATMMNKGLELIEACHLFDLSEDTDKCGDSSTKYHSLNGRI